MCSPTQFITLALLVVSLLTCTRALMCAGKLCIDGSCVTNSTSGVEICECNSSYPDCVKEAGVNCTTLTDYCVGGSTCVMTSPGSFKCNCSAGQLGNRCELTSCSATFCHGRGECWEDASGSKTCICDGCYDAAFNCSQTVDLCANDPSMWTLQCTDNQGFCKNSCKNGEPETYCDCATGYTGATCEHEADECLEVNCTRGKCQDLFATYKCDCPTGYTGDHCELDLDECTEGFCLNDATCFNYDGGYNCTCSLGFQGVNCSQPTCDEEPLCMNNGSCGTNDVNWFCDCPDFYEGKRCEDKGPCVDAPCVHGNCSQSRVGGMLQHMCTCEPGWTNNSTCADNINECENPSACKNNGECTDTVGSFTCNCTDFWTGPTCDQDVAECDRNPCDHGRCVELPGNYSCDCTGTGFSGRHCSEDIDECSTSSCQNGANCTNTVGSFICHCLDGWEGRLCENVDYCSRNCVTANTKSCENLADRAKCTCKENYTGPDCSDMDPCVSSPCENGGSCNPSNSSDAAYTCDCVSGYTGTQCQTSDASVLTTTPKPDGPDLALAIAVPLVVAFIVAVIIGVIVCVVLAKKKRATRGRYSPSRNEILGPNLQMSGMLKPPPEERLI